MHYIFQIKKYFYKIWKKIFSVFLRIYHKFLSLFLRFKIKINCPDFAEVPVSFRDDALKLPDPGLNRLRPTYVFIRRLEFMPEININKMRDFKSLLKWRLLNLDYPVVMRNYPLRFTAGLKRFDKPELELKTPPKVLFLQKEDIHLLKRLKTYEEIVTVMPYVKKADKKKIFRIPIIKQPLLKYYFSRMQMRLLREKAAQQNNTSWINIQVFEIYDKFYPNLYLNIKQAQGSKALECHISASASHKNPKKNYYLVIGQRRDNNQSIKAIVDSADIKKVEHS